MLEQLHISKKTLIIATLSGLAVIALLIRLPFLHYQSGDYVSYLLPWYNHLSQEGFSAFKDNFANYNFPYLYILWGLATLHLPALVSIKAVSFLFEIAMAYAVYLILRHYKPTSWLPAFAGVLVLYLPTIVMNSSVWAQCDAIYATFVLYSFYAILKDRRVAAWLLWGVALAFKLQAMFFLPVLVFLWLTSKKARLYDPLIGLVPFIISCVPPLLAGQALDSVLAVYATQSLLYPYLSANAPSIFGLLHFGPTEFIRAGQLVALAAVGGMITTTILFAKRDNKQHYLLALAALSVFALPYLLPQMHERYFYLAELFIFMLSMVSLRAFWIACVVQLVSGIMYLVEFLGDDAVPFGLPALSVAMGIALLGLLYYYLRYFTTIPLKDWFADHK